MDFIKIIAQGGLFIFPLFICSIITVAVIAERFTVFASIMKNPLERYPNPQFEINRLRQRLTVLHTIITISPMLGLIGTVLGLMKSFRVLGFSGVSSNPAQISLGISEALITTATGLIIAVIAIVFYNYFTSRLERYIDEYNLGSGGGNDEETR